MIKEVVIVEGRDDENRVREACECDTIATSGFGISKDTIDRIKNAYEKRGIIIFTDPDFAGQKIRKRLDDMFPNSKHAYLSPCEATKNGDVGIENAKKESIIRALEKASAEISENEITFFEEDLFENGMTFGHGARSKRQFVGTFLGIGYGNSKEFLRRLNSYEIKREKFYEALQEWEHKYG